MNDRGLVISCYMTTKGILGPEKNILFISGESSIYDTIGHVLPSL